MSRPVTEPPPAGAGANAPLSPRAAREAAQWLSRLHAGALTAAEQRRCEAWRQSDPEHERAWRRAELVAHKLGLVPAAVALPTLRRADSTQRRNAIKTLALLVGAAPLGWAAWRAAPWDEWSADVRTASGERRSLTLADGSRVVLNTASALDVRFDGGARRLLLRAGELLLQTAPERATRPFLLECAHGVLELFDARLVLRQHEARGRRAAHGSVAVLRGSVRLRPSAAGAGAAPLTLAAGQQARFDANGLSGDIEALAPGAGSWADGVLYAEQMPLADFLAELARYRPGLLRCDPAVAGLRVSGAFQLRDTDKILQALAATLPLRIARHTRYWVTVGPA
jgi:transmembrane sensor